MPGGAGTMGRSAGRGEVVPSVLIKGPGCVNKKSRQSWKARERAISQDFKVFILRD